MNKPTCKLLTVNFMLFFLIHAVSAQEPDTVKNLAPLDSTRERLLSMIESNDIGYLWKGDISQDNRIGYIGDDFQRLQIRFLSVIQNFDNPYEYFLYGKTRVETNICEFQGSLRIAEAGYFNDQDYPGFVRANLTGDFVLFEDQSCLHSGIFSGNFNTNVYMDPDGFILYDDLEKDKKEYTNNEFFGEWEGYDPFEVKICNWGDYRIPFSAGLDMGQEEFKPSFRYLENGWKEFLEEREKLKKGDELERWWEN